MKAFLVIEPGQAIWGVFRKKKHALGFMDREFNGTNGKVQVKGVKVYRSLKAAQKSNGDHLDFAVNLE